MEEKRLRPTTISIAIILMIYGGLALFHFLVDLVMVSTGAMYFKSIFAPWLNFHDSYTTLSYFYHFSPTQIYLCFFLYSMQSIFIPIGYSLGGIAVLLKQRVRKVILSMAIIDVAMKLITLCIVPLKSNHAPAVVSSLGKILLSTNFRVLVFCLRFIFDILIIFYLIRPKVKEQFK